MMRWIVRRTIDDAHDAAPGGTYTANARAAPLARSHAVQRFQTGATHYRA